MKDKSTSRRGFVKKSVIVAAGITIIPRHVMGGTGFMAPSDQLTKAVIGVGGMGQGHLTYEGTKLLAICDADGKHLENTWNLTCKFKWPPCIMLRLHNHQYFFLVTPSLNREMPS